MGINSLENWKIDGEVVIDLDNPRKLEPEPVMRTAKTVTHFTWKSWELEATSNLESGVLGGRGEKRICWQLL